MHPLLSKIAHVYRPIIIVMLCLSLFDLAPSLYSQGQRQCCFWPDEEYTYLMASAATTLGAASNTASISAFAQRIVILYTEAGWDDFDGNIIAEYTPPGASYTDTCWSNYYDTYGVPPAEDEATGVTGGQWTVGGYALDGHAPYDYTVENYWGYDGVGRKTGAVDYYRRYGSAPCGFTIEQSLEILCQYTLGPLWQTYAFDNTLTEYMNLNSGAGEANCRYDLDEDSCGYPSY